jgi:hypothetical protein
MADLNVDHPAEGAPTMSKISFSDAEHVIELGAVVSCFVSAARIG